MEIFKSHADLVQAGYHRCALTSCPHCGRGLAIYMRRQEFPVFLNAHTFRPHLEFVHVESVRPANQLLRLDAKQRASGERDDS